MRSSVVLPQPDGPSSVNSSPSPMARSTRSTAAVAPKRLTSPSTAMSAMVSRRSFRLLEVVPPGLDVGAEARLERLGALGRHVLVVDVGDLLVEVRAHAAGELHGELRGGAGRALHLVPAPDRE